MELALLLAVTLYSIQAAYSTDFETAVKNVAFFYIPFALLLKLLTSLDWTARLMTWCMRVLVGLAVLFVLVGFWEYHARQLLWNPKVIESNQFQSYFRVNSLFFDPNIYGRFLVMVMVALAALLLWNTRPRAILGYAALLALLWGGLVLSFSQSSIAALLVGLAVLAAVRWRAKPVIAVLAAGLVAAAIVVFAAPGSIHLRGHSAKSLNHATSGRFNLMKGGLRMFADRPVYGYGAGSFAERFRAREKKSEAQAASASHTIPITVAAEQGVVGLGVYVFLLVVSFRLLFGGLLELRGPGPPSAPHAGAGGGRRGVHRRSPSTRCSTRTSSRTRSRGPCSAWALRCAEARRWPSACRAAPLGHAGGGEHLVPGVVGLDLRGQAVAEIDQVAELALHLDPLAPAAAEAGQPHHAVLARLDQPHGHDRELLPRPHDAVHEAEEVVAAAVLAVEAGEDAGRLHHDVVGHVAEQLVDVAAAPGRVAQAHRLHVPHEEEAYLPLCEAAGRTGSSSR